MSSVNASQNQQEIGTALAGRPPRDAVVQRAARSNDLVAQMPLGAKGNSGVEPLFRATDQRRAERADNWFDAQVKRGRHEQFGIPRDLTPELAERLIKQNPHNRRLSRVNIEKIKRDIVNGAYVLNGETIIISQDGHMNDGQHRCVAVVETGMTVRTAFWFGADRDSRFSVDMGTARTAAHFLEMKTNVANTTGVATCCKWLLQIERHGAIEGRPDRIPTKQEIIEWWHDHRDVEDSVSSVPCNTSRVGGANAIATAHYCFKQIDPVAADYFVQRLIKGDQLQTGNPIYVLRETLTREYLKSQKSARDVGLTPNNRVELLFRAWNSMRAGGRVRQIKIMGGPLPKLR